MKKVLFYFSSLLLLFSFSACQKEITGKDVSKELYDSLKVIYEKGLSENAGMPIDQVMKCREGIEKKYAEQLKNEAFRKEFEDQNKIYIKELDKLVQKYPTQQTIIKASPEQTIEQAEPAPVKPTDYKSPAMDPGKSNVIKSSDMKEGKK